MKSINDFKGEIKKSRIEAKTGKQLLINATLESLRLTAIADIKELMNEVDEIHKQDDLEMVTFASKIMENIAKIDYIMKKFDIKEDEAGIDIPGM